MGALDFLGGVTAPTRQIAAEVHAHLERNGTPLPTYPDMKSQVIWGYNAGGAEHGTGRALDFMVMRPGPVGEAVVDYVWENRERFGLVHIIWRQRIRSTRTQPGVWRAMSDRGSPTENHMDHPHCFFDGRAVKGKPSAPSAGSTVSTVSTKTYTRDNVRRFQRVHGLTDDGYWGKDTERQAQAIRRTLKPGMKRGKWDLVRYWRLRLSRKPRSEQSSVEMRKGIQWALNVKSDGIWGPATDAAWHAIRDQHKMKGV